MKKVQRTLAAALAAMMLMALAGCSKGDVTKEVNSGLSELKEMCIRDRWNTASKARICRKSLFTGTLD